MPQLEAISGRSSCIAIPLFECAIWPVSLILRLYLITSYAIRLQFIIGILVVIAS
ncbi:hypothetical protein BJ508DRAFT_417258 [Ascobolus immersus RN42]|uniref:Uncharacterized protein n=1 Tax=Ascobolus immersus RN42 TaxID=1160509 RepID=A0A3N4I5P1_ASCIM|nr:hypothetical protein BJ508DRAFT_417258 [Ascobolus immersus RN42]